MECSGLNAGVPHLLPVNIAGCYGNHCGLPHEPGQERSDPKRGPVNPTTQKDAGFVFFKGASVQREGQCFVFLVDMKENVK